MPWESLLADEALLAKFVRDSNATALEMGARCHCFYLDWPEAKLEEWFSKQLASEGVGKMGRV